MANITLVGLPRTLSLPLQFTGDIMWQLMDLSSTSIAKIDVCLVIFATSCYFWHDYVVNSVFNILGRVLPK